MNSNKELRAFRKKHKAEYRELYFVDDDGKEEKMELWGYRINGHFRTDEVFHKKMGGTKRCFELDSIRYPNWIMRFKVERTTIRELVKKGIISQADLVKMVKKNKPS